MVEYSMTVDELQRNIQSVTAAVTRAASKAGHSVTLVAAVKTVPPELINAAIDYGITDIGDNRVQEFLAKADAVKKAKRHFIGTLQRNKAKYLVGKVGLIQSVNSVELATEIDRLAGKLGIVQNVLIEVNAAGESSKTGAPLQNVDALIARVSALEHVAVRGIMSIPPIGADDSTYESLYALFAKYQSSTFDTLSVGMSGDYEKAIAHGSNMVRIGTAIFGKRQQIN